MKTKEIMTHVTKALGKVRFGLKKHSPEILLVAGVVGTVASAVIACKATTKAGMILENTQSDIDAIHRCMEDKTLAEDYSDEDAKKDLAIVYVQTAGRFIKLYAPSVILGAASIVSIVASHRILQKRNIALAAAYATIDKGFKEYRKRVAERFGEEVEKELRYNIKAKKLEEKMIDEETGKEKKVKNTVSVTNIDGYSDYARFFDESSRNWEKNSEYNLMFLRAQQSYANDKLRANGYLFLNDVYDMLDIPRTKAGQIVGWIYDEEHPIGDNYVDFGIYEINREKARDFVNGYERSILLDFNVDGNIFDLM